MIPDVKVPEHIEQKVQEVIRSYGKYQASLEARYLRNGYSLAAAELEARDSIIEKQHAQICRLCGEIGIDKHVHDDLQIQIARLKGLLEKEVKLRSESELYGKIPSSYGPTPNDFKENADKTWDEYKQANNL